MSTTDNTLATITTLLDELIGASAIDPDENLLDSGKLTSLTSMNLILAIETAFAIQIPNRELNRSNFTNLRSLAAMVERVRFMT